MNALIASLQFISALPLGKPRPFDPRGIIVSFPLAGLAIGLLLAIFLIGYLGYQIREQGVDNFLAALQTVPPDLPEAPSPKYLLKQALVGHRMAPWPPAPETCWPATST